MLELIFVEGERAGEAIRLTFEKAWFGRQPTCDFVLTSEDVSPTHFCIVKRGEDYVLLDNKSANGTFVNGVRINEVTLRDGDQIAAGSDVMQVREAREAAPQAFRFVARRQGGDGRLQVIEETTILLGRMNTCHVQLNDPAISRVHAKLERRAEGVWILDRSSAAGIYVNGRRVTEQQLHDGDVITIRHFEISVSLTEETCVLGIRESSAEPQPTTEDLPQNYRAVVAPVQRPGAGDTKPSAAIAALPLWMQAKAPIWVPT